MPGNVTARGLSIVFDCPQIALKFLFFFISAPQCGNLTWRQGWHIIKVEAFLILDSAWSEERARVNTKVERQIRGLNDGTTFAIYKRYLDENDIGAWSDKYSTSLCVEYVGPGFFAVSGKFV